MKQDEKSFDFWNYLDKATKEYQQLCLVKEELEKCGINSEAYYNYKISLITQVLLGLIVEIAERILNYSSFLEKQLAHLESLLSAQENIIEMKIQKGIAQLKEQLFQEMLKKSEKQEGYK